MARFIPYDYSQNAVVVVNFQTRIHPVYCCLPVKAFLVDTKSGISLPTSTPAFTEALCRYSAASGNICFPSQARMMLAALRLICSMIFVFPSVSPSL